MPATEEMYERVVREGSRRRRKRGRLLFGASVLIVVAIATPFVLRHGQRTDGVVATIDGTTPSSSATTVTTTSPPGSTVPSEPAWSSQPNPPGLAGYLAHVTCPTRTRCYAVGAVPQGSGEIIASTDGGDTWHVQTTVLPPNANSFAFSGVACMTDIDCVAVGQALSTTQLTALAVVTHDGGQSWTSAPLPPVIANLDQVTCPTTSVCLAEGFAQPPTVPSPGQNPPMIARTTDRGSSWSLVPVPDGFATVTDIVCASSSRCILGGSDTGADCSSCSHALVATSDDAGASWGPAVDTGGTQWLRDISCLDAATCVGAANSNSTQPFVPGYLTVTHDGGQTWTTVDAVNGSAVSCTANVCLAVGATYDTATNSSTATAFFYSRDTDGWTPITPPASQGFESLACVTDNRCILVGSNNPPVITTFSR